MKKFILILLTTLSLQLKAQYTIENVPNPKDSDGGWVSNPDQILSTSEVAEINELISGVEHSTTAQIAVVVLNSIGDEVPKDFANRLFNYWGIGQKDKDNGLLLLIVMNPKRWEFETGYGLESSLPDVTLFRIGQQEMVPYFKEGAYGSGILAGLNKVKEILENPANAADIYSDANSERTVYKASDLYKVFGVISAIITFAALMIRFSRSHSYKSALHESRRKSNHKKESGFRVKPMNRNLFIFILLSVPVLFFSNSYNDFFFDSRNPFHFIFIQYLQLTFFAVASRISTNINIKHEDPYEEFKALKESHYSITLILQTFFFPLIFIPYLIWLSYRKKSLRNAPRYSSTGAPMRKLDEVSDDQFLNKGQILEENLRSVDYDVWTNEDLSEQKILAYPKLISKYTECPKCKFITKYVKSDVTIVSATYDHSGQGEKTFSCKNCNHSNKVSYTIPRLTRSDSGGSGGSSSSSSSFGGGSSGGGGAGGSW